MNNIKNNTIYLIKLSCEYRNKNNIAKNPSFNSIFLNKIQNSF